MRRHIAIAIGLVLLLAGCDYPFLITSPGEGQIVETITVPVSGNVNGLRAGGVLTVDGVVFPVNPDQTWNATVEVDPSEWVTVFEVIYTDPSGITYRHRRAVLFGNGLGDGEYSPDGVGLKFTNSGLASLGPVIEDMAAGSFDIESQLMANNPAIETTISGLAVTGNVYEAGMDHVGLTTTGTAAGMNTTINIDDLFVGLDLEISIVGDCKLEITIDSAQIQGNFDLQPKPGDPSHVDVNLIGTPTVNLTGFNKQFISGACDPDAPIIGPIINALAGDSIGPSVTEAFQTQLGDPDGSGPGDSPIADAVEEALAGLHIAGDVGAALGVNLDAPITSITESATGLTLKSNADFFATVGGGPTDCPAVAHAPDIFSTMDIPNSFPSLGSTTPGGTPYGIGMIISASAFNQLLGAMAECGKFNQEITSLDLDGPGPLPPTALTSSVLAFIEPKLATAVPPDTPMSLRIIPTAAPFVTDDPGPNGEAATLLVPNIQIQFITNPGTATEGRVLQLNLDAPLGLDMAFDAVNNALVPTITPGPPGSVEARVVENIIGANNTNIENLFEAVFPTFVDDLASSFAAFPLPSFLGLQLSVVEVVRIGNAFVLFSNITPVPQTRLANVVMSDTSDADFEEDDALSDSQQWRHRIRRQTTSTSINTQYQFSIGADAATPFDDETIDKTGRYQLSFDIIPENGESYSVNLAQQFRGAHTHVGEGNRANTQFVNPSGFTNHFVGRYSTNGGASWTNFNFNVSPASQSSLESNLNTGVFNSNSAVITGNTQQHVIVQYFMRFFATSDSNANPFGDFGDGSEAAIRGGLNDTLTNGFTAGEYPGQGSRVAANDGQFSTITLTVL
jgi:hypothetical protein